MPGRHFKCKLLSDVKTKMERTYHYPCVCCVRHVHHLVCSVVSLTECQVSIFVPFCLLIQSSGSYLWRICFLWHKKSYRLKYFRRFYLLIFRQRGRKGEREGNITVWVPLMHPLLGTWPTTQACAVIRNRTLASLALKPLNHTSQGHIVKTWYTFFESTQ